MEGGSSMFFNNFSNLGWVENRKKHESAEKKHFRDSLPDRLNGGFDEKKHEKHKKHPLAPKSAGASPDPHMWIHTCRWGKSVFCVFRVSTVITYTYNVFFICFFIFFMCFYVFLPTYALNHTKSLWIEIHSPAHALPWQQHRGSQLGAAQARTPQADPAFSPWQHLSGSTFTMASNRRERAPLHGRMNNLSRQGQGTPS